ncbi:MAG: leucine--tRNA ligase [Sphingobacteriales bacterium]|nr:leucine--tRNA ligase [Sphingobacteriales bacterium]
MDYQFRKIEQDWQRYWAENKVFKTENKSNKPKFYVLDMFPYPSGAGLHVGHPLGYIATDIFSRYKRLKGYNVLHPMGYDSFGLPAEQYAIQTGQHPAVTTAQNVARYREQLDRVGFSFDWDREVKTSDPAYYRWTQWIFEELFNSWYNNSSDKAVDINTLISLFANEGNAKVNAAQHEQDIFTAEEWNSFSEEKQQNILLSYRLAYLADSWVNWCPALGTVLANDEVKDGYSERGGYPVEQKLMRQWSMRITAYADRLINGLETIDWPDPVKEMQRNWIGKSKGSSLKFENIEVFTTRPDTVFGVSFLVLAPEHELVDQFTTAEFKDAVEVYKKVSAVKSERDRMSDVKTITGQFTGGYVKHPFSGENIPVWIGDYVLASYGTGAVMAVAAHDTRDYAFAKHFNLPITQVVEGGDITVEAYDAKEGKLINSDFLNGLDVKEAMQKCIEEIEKRNLGKGKINYRLRDAVFGRQRYWGEPIPVYYKNGMPYLVDKKDLPLELPSVDKFLPTETGEPPLARATDWKYENQYEYELTTMPGWAGSSWYFLRYMDPTNTNEFASREALDYWNQVDLYIGGSEHATGHLLYSRFWNKFLKDKGFLNFEEPFQKLINQGMIQGRSNFVYRINGTNKFVSYDLRKDYQTTALHVDVNIVSNDVLDIEKFKVSLPEYHDAEFILSDGKYLCGFEVEKMSKSKYNVVNPDDIIERYGADTLRMYEMFLGPLEQSKPWNTNGIEGVFKFLRKYWKLFHNDNFDFVVSDETPTKEEYKSLHKIIKKVQDDVEKFSFNTSVSSFMICVNELTDLKCNKREILRELTITLSPYAPHITEECWKLLGEKESITYATYPIFKEEYLVESEFSYPISFNGKTRTNISMPVDIAEADAKAIVLANADVQKQLEGKDLKKFIFVKGRIVNIVC